MPDAEEKTGIEVYAKDEFSRVFKTYERGLKQIEGQTVATARSLGRSSDALGSWETGLESTFDRMRTLSGEATDARARAQDLQRQMDQGGTSAAGLASALGGTAAAIAAVGAAAVYGFSKLVEAIQPSLDRHKELQAAQEELNETWQQASDEMAQALGPVMAEWTRLKTVALEALLPLIEKVKEWIAYVHIGANAVYKFGKAFSDWHEILQQGPLAAIPALIRSLGDAEKRQEVWNEVVSDADKIWDRYQVKLEDVAEETEEEDFTPKVDESWKRVIDVTENALARIRQLQEDHNLQMQRAEEDAAIARARAWTDYEKKVAKEIGKGEKSLAKLTEKYEKDRTKAVEDAQADVAEAEEKAYRDREKAERDFQRDLRQARERYNLDVLQDQRRYQFERNRLVAEGDTLAIEQLDEQFKLEQQEAKENRQLEDKQEKESFGDRLRDMQQAADETLRETRAQLSDVLAEQEAAYQEQLQQQKDATAERLAEMASEFAESQRLQDEDRSLAMARREEDYRRQLAQQGQALGQQLSELGVHHTAAEALLRKHYGPGGLADAVLSEFHTREMERIAVTATAMSRLAQSYSEVEQPWSWEGMGWSGVTPMQHGGVVTGPRLVGIEAGMTEAIIPLRSQHISVGWSGGAIPITGLEGASQSDVSSIASSLARELTAQIHALRRS